MTEQHPITPPPELVKEWMAEIWHEGTPVRVAASDLHIATQAARWGSDMELEACCEWLRHDLDAYELVGLRAVYLDHNLRAARRPKPSSLKEQALKAATEMADCMKAGFVPKRSDLDLIRRDLEQLND